MVVCSSGVRLVVRVELIGVMVGGAHCTAIDLQKQKNFEYIWFSCTHHEVQLVRFDERRVVPFSLTFPCVVILTS